MVAYKNTNNIDKAFKLYEELEKRQDLVLDEVFLGVFMRICAKIHHAEMAIKVFEKLKEDRQNMTCLPINSYIKALASRKDYAEKAIETFRAELTGNMQPDIDTYISVLKATATIGDVKTAYDVIQYIKEAEMPINKYIYNGLLRTYAGAISAQITLPSLRDLYMKDAWELFKNVTIKSPEMVNPVMVDSLLLVHTNGFEIDKVEGLV